MKSIERDENKKIIAVDFDGVLHSYSSGWQGYAGIPDPPNPGAIEWLRTLIEDDRFRVVIFSSRNREDEGIIAMKGWLIQHELTNDELRNLRFPKEKPSAFLTIDDRAFLFKGVFPTPTQINAFKPWYR